ncbi:unnamed protein product, partial [Sphagnum balticum]
MAQLQWMLVAIIIASMLPVVDHTCSTGLLLALRAVSVMHSQRSTNVPRHRVFTVRRALTLLATMSVPAPAPLDTRATTVPQVYIDECDSSPCWYNSTCVEKNCSIYNDINSGIPNSTGVNAKWRDGHELRNG